MWLPVGSKQVQLDMTPWRILLVDDEEDMHLITKLALKRKKWRGRPFAITIARSGSEAREVIATAETPFHLALVDVIMESDSAGVDLANHIRAQHGKETRIIVRTGRQDPESREELMAQADFDAYLPKATMSEQGLFEAICAQLPE